MHFKLYFPWLVRFCGLWLLWPNYVVAVEPQALPFKADSSDGAPLGVVTLFLIVVAVLLMLLLSILKRKRRGDKSARWLNWLPTQEDNDAVQIIASKRVTPKVSVHVIEWEGGKVLFAISDQNIARLDEVAVAKQLNRQPTENER